MLASITNSATTLPSESAAIGFIALVYVAAGRLILSLRIRDPLGASPGEPPSEISVATSTKGRALA